MSERSYADCHAQMKALRARIEDLTERASGWPAKPNAHLPQARLGIALRILETVKGEARAAYWACSPMDPCTDAKGRCDHYRFGPLPLE